MLKRYAIPLLILLTIGSFTMEVFTVAMNNTGAAILQDQVGKLSRGMTCDEVLKCIGKPTVDIGSGRYIPVYLFDGGESLTLTFDFNNKLSTAQNKDGFDLLSREYSAKLAEFPVLVNGEEIITSNPIVTINDKTYIPLKEMETQLGIKVEWSEEEGTVKIITE